MQVQPINKMSFYGKEINYAYKLGPAGLKTHPDFHRFSSIEETINAFHTGVKNKVYFADPMENVPGTLKEKVDFVVYDNEPSYPALEDIKKNYLEHNRTNYREYFEDIRNYYYRREMGGHANIEEAKENQRKAAAFTRLYDDAGDLRYKKESTEDRIKALLKEKENIKAGIENTEQEIKIQKELSINAQKEYDNLKKLQVVLEEIEKNDASSIESNLYSKARVRMDIAKNNEPKHGPYNKFENIVSGFDVINTSEKGAYKFAPQEKALQKKILNIGNTAKDFKVAIIRAKNSIEKMKTYVEDLKSFDLTIDQEIKQKQEFIEECKQKLKPMFNEIVKLYKDFGVKVAEKRI